MRMSASLVLICTLGMAVMLPQARVAWAEDVTGGQLKNYMSQQQYRALLEQKLGLLDNLLSSTLVSRIERSGMPDLPAELQALRDLRAEARQSLDAEKFDHASSVLDKAMLRISDVSARLPKRLSENEIEQRALVVDMIDDAERTYRRLLRAMDVESDDDVPATAQQFRDQIDEAKEHAASGNLKRARILLRRATQASKQVMESLGEIEFEEDPFATPRDVFLRERHRLEIRTALLNTMVAQSKAPTPTLALVQRVRMQSEEFRLGAEDAAKQEAFEQAVDAMRQAIKLVEKALIVVGPQH